MRSQSEIAPAASASLRARLADRDCQAGLLLAALGAAATWLASDLSLGTLARPGGGFVPLLAGIATLVSGIGLSVWSLFRADAVCADAPIARRPVGGTLATPLAFVLAHAAGGLPAACVATAICGAWASGARAPRAAAIGAVMGAGAYLAFGIAFGAR